MRIEVGSIYGTCLHDRVHEDLVRHGRPDRPTGAQPAKINTSNRQPPPKNPREHARACDGSLGWVERRLCLCAYPLDRS